MIQKKLYQTAAQSQAHFENPPVLLKESKQAPLLSYTGVVIARNLIKKLGIAEAIDQNLSILKRHKPYYESDHVLDIVYNFLNGGEALVDIEKLQEDRSFLKVLGAKRVPDPTTAGDFLARFLDSDIAKFQGAVEKIQDKTFFLLGKGRKKVKKRKKRENHKKAVGLKRNPNMKFKRKVEVASFVYQPVGWEKPYRFVVKRTEIVDKSNQLYLEDGLGLSHVPTGFFNANKVYFMIAALAWNIKTWMLNLLKIGDGSVLRFKRFLYQWIYCASIVSTTGRNMVVIRMTADSYFHRFQRALTRVDLL